MTELRLIVNFVGGESIAVQVPTEKRKDTAEWLLDQMKLGTMAIFQEPQGAVAAAGRGSLITSFMFEMAPPSGPNLEIGEINALHLRRLKAEVELAERAIKRGNEGNEWKSGY